jgi:hypothetical protein
VTTTQPPRPFGMTIPTRRAARPRGEVARATNHRFGGSLPGRESWRAVLGDARRRGRARLASLVAGDAVDPPLRGAPDFDAVLAAGLLPRLDEPARASLADAGWQLRRVDDQPDRPYCAIAVAAP